MFHLVIFCVFLPNHADVSVKPVVIEKIIFEPVDTNVHINIGWAAATKYKYQLSIVDNLSRIKAVWVS